MQLLLLGKQSETKRKGKPRETDLSDPTKGRVFGEGRPRISNIFRTFQAMNRRKGEGRQKEKCKGFFKEGGQKKP
jgi:hypothetical protein